MSFQDPDNFSKENDDKEWTDKLERITAENLEHAAAREERWFNEPTFIERIIEGINKIKAKAAKKRTQKKVHNKTTKQIKTR